MFDVIFMGEKYVGPMASFTDKAIFPIETPLNEVGSIDYLELWKRVDENGRKLHGFYRKFQR